MTIVVAGVALGLIVYCVGLAAWLFKNRHQHQWTEDNRIFQAPCMPQKWEGDQTSEFFAFLRESKWGFTVVELHCVECGDPKFVKVVGDARSRISAVSERKACP